MGRKDDLSELDRAHLKIHRLENIIAKMGQVVNECMEYTQDIERKYEPDKYSSGRTIHEDEVDPFIDKVDVV